MKLQYYQEIRLFPDQKGGLWKIGADLFSLLHFGFVNNKNEFGKGRFALSFPEYAKGGNRTLGRIFRIFAYDQKSLINLNISQIIDKLSGYVECSDIALVPESTTYLRFYRVQSKTNAERLARRMVKRKSVTLEEAREAYKEFKPIAINHLPSLYIKSYSSQNAFRIYIDCKCELEEKVEEFNLYGLSLGGNVPDF